MHSNRHRIQPSLRSQSTKLLPRKNRGNVQTVRFGVSFALSLFLTLVAAAHESTTALSGTVVDADGKPLPGAMVIVAEGPSALFRKRTELSSAVEAPEVLDSATADDAGKFSVSLPNEAPDVGSRRWRLAVWAYHPNAALCVRLIDREWLRAGLPLPLTLDRAESVRLKIAGADWRPISHAHVAPQRVAGHGVPAVLREQLSVPADAKGAATLTGVVSAELEAVRIESETCGSQWAGVPRREHDQAALVSLAPVGRLVGRLTADEPTALRRRKVRFTTWQVPADEDAGGGIADVITDDEGRFEVPAIAAGSLAFEIEQDTEPVYLSEQSTGPQVEPGKATECETRLRRAVFVTHEVRDRDDGTPIAGALIFLTYWAPNGPRGVSDEQGRVGAHVLPGPVEPLPIRIPPPYYLPQRSGNFEVVGDENETMTLKPLLLARGAAIRGRVVDENQRHVAGAYVVGVWTLPNGDHRPICAVSNEKGEFSIDGIAADASVRLWAGKKEAITAEVISARPGGEPVTIVIDPKSSVSLEGRVVDVAGRPIAGAAVRIWAERRQDASRQGKLILGSLLFDGNDRVATDAEGRFRTPRWLPPDVRYSLEVEAPGMVPVDTEAIEPATWRTTRFADVVLQQAPRLRAMNGRVVDSQGSAVAGAAVWQSGDGPRRTETISDDDGHFQLGGIYDGPAFIFARKDGFRLQGARVAAADKSCEITLRRFDEQAKTMATLPPSLSRDERRELAVSLVEPWLPTLRNPALRVEDVGLLMMIGSCDPARALEMADTDLVSPQNKSIARGAAARGLLETDLDAALAASALIEQPFQRARSCLHAWDVLRGRPHDERRKPLEEALIHARAEINPGQKVFLLGQIAERWLDMGDRQRGTALSHEGQA